MSGKGPSSEGLRPSQAEVSQARNTNNPWTFLKDAPKNVRNYLKEGREAQAALTRVEQIEGERRQERATKMAVRDTLKGKNGAKKEPQLIDGKYFPIRGGAENSSQLDAYDQLVDSQRPELKEIATAFRKLKPVLENLLESQVDKPKIRQQLRELFRSGDLAVIYKLCETLRNQLKTRSASSLTLLKNSEFNTAFIQDANALALLNKNLENSVGLITRQARQLKDREGVDVGHWQDNVKHLTWEQVAYSAIPEEVKSEQKSQTLPVPFEEAFKGEPINSLKPER